MLLALLIIVALLVLMGLGNNNRLGDWLQPTYTRAMARLQEIHDARAERFAGSFWGRFFGYIGTAIIVVMALLMFGAGELIWPEEESNSLGRIFLLPVFLYFAYRLGKLGR